MAIPTSYNYSITTDFGGLINISALVNAIHKSSGVTIDLENERIDTEGDIVSIYFKDALGTDDLSALDDVIAIHDGSPTPSLDLVNINNTPEVYSRRPPNKKRIYVFSYNWCDETTWYQGSTKVTDKNIGTGDGNKTIFVIEPTYPVIEIGRGKVTDDHTLVAPDSGDYRIVVKTGTASAGYTILNEREEYESSGGDYWINYGGGTDGVTVEFVIAPVLSDDILVTYYYVNTGVAGCSCFEFGPPVGKQWIIDHIEAQFTNDVVITDCMKYQACLDHPIYGKIPVPGEPEVRYNTASNFDDYVVGALPTLPAWGGSGLRGRQQTVHVVQWDYASSVVLSGNSKVYMKMWLHKDRVFDGTRATVTVYALEEDEPT